MNHDRTKKQSKPFPLPVKLPRTSPLSSPTTPNYRPSPKLDLPLRQYKSLPSRPKTLEEIQRFGTMGSFKSEADLGEVNPSFRPLLGDSNVSSVSPTNDISEGARSIVLVYSEFDSPYKSMASLTKTPECPVQDQVPQARPPQSSSPSKSKTQKFPVRTVAPKSLGKKPTGRKPPTLSETLKRSHVKYETPIALEPRPKSPSVTKAFYSPSLPSRPVPKGKGTPKSSKFR